MGGSRSRSYRRGYAWAYSFWTYVLRSVYTYPLAPWRERHEQRKRGKTSGYVAGMESGRRDAEGDYWLGRLPKVDEASRFVTSRDGSSTMSGRRAARTLHRRLARIHARHIRSEQSLRRRAPDVIREIQRRGPADVEAFAHRRLDLGKPVTNRHLVSDVLIRHLEIDLGEVISPSFPIIAIQEKNFQRALEYFEQYPPTLPCSDSVRIEGKDNSGFRIQNSEFRMK